MKNAESMQLVRGKVKIEWVNLDEGWNGVYDENDPKDENLLRFDVYRKDGRKWEAVDDSSYCTRVPAETKPKILKGLLEYLMDWLYEPVTDAHSVKKLCERLSWIKPGWERRP